jgi:hypothetical protein
MRMWLSAIRCPPHRNRGRIVTSSLLLLVRRVMVVGAGVEPLSDNGGGQNVVCDFIPER